MEYDMFKNYFKSALRNILKHKGYSFINIIGLAIGMACCLLIFVFVLDELSYDSYNEKADRIYRIAGFFKFGGRNFNNSTVPGPMAEALVNDYPEVEAGMRFHAPGSTIINYGNISFKERKLIFSDPTIFNIFTVPLLAGDPKTALKNPFTLVLSKKAAGKYFGQENAVGKILKLDNKYDYMVTGIFDSIPHNSHFHFDFIASLSSLQVSREQSWLNNNFWVYILLNKNADPKSLEAKFPEVIKKYMGPRLEEALGKSMDALVKNGNLKIEFYLQPLRSIHLHSDLESEMEPNSDIKYVYIFSVIALFILIIASINFMNLSTARSAGRAKEVGLRKVMGSHRSQLISQFQVESMILSIISMLIALILVKLSIPYFNNLSGKELTLSNYFNWEMILAVFVITLLTGFLAGIYPALIISAFQPARVLKGDFKSGTKTGLLRSSLVVFQYTASIILIIGTLVVMNQLSYIRNTKLGFDKDHVLILNNAYLLGRQAETFKNEMLAIPQFKSATISGFLPVPSKRYNNSILPEGEASNKNATSMENWTVDYDYIKTLGMKILKGRNFSRDFSSDDSEAVIINQEAAKQFGWDEPPGKRLGRFINDKGDIENFTVIGVVENFHFESLRNTIAPMVIFLGNDNELISFRINTGNISGTIDLLKDKWKKFLPNQPFEYSFLDEDFNAVYRVEQKLGEIFGVFALLAILIGCIGLFGLAAHTAQQKTKQIGIRKVLGASVSNITRLLSKEFVILVCIANIIAWPIAYFIMNKWLQYFAYRTSFTILTFIIAGIISITIALIAVSYQSVKAALVKPVDSLKYE